jgi:hypothetical protein
MYLTSTKISYQVVSRRVKKTATRTVGKSAPAAMETAVMEIGMSKKDEVVVEEEGDSVEEESCTPFR